MIKQNDRALNAKIQTYGCCFLSHLAVVNRAWTAIEVETVYALACAQGIIDANCTVKKPNDLLKMASLHKKSDIYRQLGGRLFTSKDAWGLTRGHTSVEFVIVKWRTASEHFHFSLHSPKGELYDPFDPLEATYSLHKMERVSEQYYGKMS